ncbi:MAG TPA: glycoside hydrolase family 78 protein [Terriglobales bacterium]|nr:glycoside hydrolase family 78 protein [Terriglobales bacterium]
MRQFNCVLFLSCSFRSYLRLILALVMMVATALAPVTAAPTGPARTAIPVKVLALRTEYKENPLGIDSRQPRLSWQLQGEGRGIEQSAYQVRVAQSEPELRSGRPLIWDSGRVNSDESVHRPYDGPPLQSGRRYYWQVRVWDEKSTASDWSAPAYWEMGLLQPSDWHADWIEPALNDTSGGPAPMLRREFKVSGAILRARAYVTSHSLYELNLNGHRVGDQLFTPGWTSYEKRIQYQTYDVTDLVKTGTNAVGIVLGSGWYRFKGRRIYGDHLAALVQINITYKDGHEEVVRTDQNWKSATGPILMSEIYDGETYDARLEKTGWTMPGYDDAQWAGVTTANYRKDDLFAPAGPPVRRIEEIKPVKIIKTPAGLTVVDMGQNMVGWVRLNVQGPAGTTVILRYAEVLDQQGNFYTENLRNAKATVRYTLQGGPPETFEPHFTFQGFRYVAVDGYPGELTPDSLTGVVIHSEMAPTSDFETSSKLINQLQHNILWGQKGNFLDVPTDCPQRDERLGWTGDAEVFARTAAFNMDVAGFFTKWLRDVAADQYKDGRVPTVIPDTGNQSQPPRPAAAWSDAAVIIPWTMYISYGDKRILEEQYPSMVKWVEYERQRAGNEYIWKNDFQYGDWLAYAAPNSEARSYPGATTGKDLIATAFFAYSTDLLERTAQVLGKKDDAARYGDLLAKIKAAFRREFVTETGRVGENTQTAYALALQFDLLPDELRPLAAQRLAEDVRERKHLTTGFLGTPFLCHVLSRFGYLEEAYMLLNREQYPSWLYPVKQGATTIWERWDGIKPDGSFQDKSMNSFNHYAYGAIGEWMYRVMAGIEIDPEAPGYKHTLIQPQPGGGFTSVTASHLTMYGKVSSAWALKDNRFELTVEIPANTHATVRLPHAQLADVTESDQALANAGGIRAARQDGDSVLLEIGSGQYRFALNQRRGETAVR